MNNVTIVTPRSVLSRTGLGLLGALAIALPTSQAAGVSDLPLVVYGKITHVDQGATYQVFDGTLSLTLTQAANPANSVTLTTQLAPTGTGGVESYRIEFPLESLPDPDQLGSVLTVGVNPISYFLDGTSVNGSAASALDSSAETIITSFATRGTEYRLDLLVSLPQDDTDGDGLPDWWEEQNGLNPLFAGDATDDPDGDGIDNLGEFLGTTDPNASNNQPTILTTSLLVPSGGEAGLYIALVDADLVTGASTPSDLALAFDQAVPGLTIVSADSGPLAPGEFFTYQDILDGKITMQIARDFTEMFLELSMIDALNITETISHDLVIQPYSPTDVAPSMWLDKQSFLSASTPDGPIDEWDDLSGNNRDGYQPFASNQPGWLAASGGSLVFDDSDDFLYVDDRALVLGDFTAFFAFEVDVFNAADHTLFRHNDLEITIGGTANGTQAQSLVVTESGREISGPVLAAAVGNQFTVVHGPDASYLTRAGEDFTSSDTTGGALAPGFSTLGGHQEFSEPAPHSFFNGSISEVILFAGSIDPGWRSRIEDYQLSRWSSVVVWDYRNETLPLTITGVAGQRNALSGGWGADTLTGSDQADILRSGPANDLLTGAGGGDRLQFFKGDGNDTVTDFSETEGDVVDLTPIFGTIPGTPDQFVFIRTEVGRDENNFPVVQSVLELDYDGGLDDVDQRITLQGHAYTQLDLPRLVGEGFIQLGGPQFGNQVGLLAAETDLIETEVARALTLTRSGNLDAELVVPLSFVGSAEIGTDYVTTNCGAQNGVVVEACFPRGQSTTTVDLTPIQDQINEMETITVTILPTPQIAATSAPLNLTLTDAPSVAITTLNQYAERIGPVPGIIELSRTGPLTETLEIALDFSGSAVNGTDYDLLPSTFSFPAGVSTAQLMITPTSVPLPADAKTAGIAVAEDKTKYALAAISDSTVFILDEAFTFAEFRATHFPGDPDDDQLLAVRNDDSDPYDNGWEYAYGTNPTQVDFTTGTLRITRLPDGRVELDVRTLNGLVDAAFELQQSPNLQAWSDVTADFDLDLTVLPNSRLRRLYRSKEPVAPSRQFFRLGITITTATTP